MERRRKQQDVSLGLVLVAFEGSEVTVDLRNGERVRGRVVAADKDTLSLWLQGDGQGGAPRHIAGGSIHCVNLPPSLPVARAVSDHASKLHRASQAYARKRRKNRGADRPPPEDVAPIEVPYDEANDASARRVGKQVLGGRQ